MEVILKQDVKNLGDKDDVVNVKPGYGRNFLIPKGYAILATESARKVLAENIKQAQFKQEKIRKDADAIAAKLEGVKLTIGAKAGESGKIFGAINTIQVADALKKEGFDVDRRRITFDQEPKVLGEYVANVNLHKEVKVQVPFEVVAE
ncbi:50S ribosomal protein L9 [Mucilaginibacter achroorhodeus]|uniref:Large ribosomal subunit protein bL9 n=1 Tax=Mucilaginibacter achroorhodeus TaxID=2599294 RepID=A0A563U926_9SPHI|nr:MULTISPECIES: 50S ribosomal protein L9 [Mucilaginibacter]QXV67196.1 50S ribosomal protein L9 [Mucilaginibacter sp. 21P]TWR27838.1 50S ribosomal protein L9 [Mucilaginibacter achroorhodeus]